MSVIFGWRILIKFKWDFEGIVQQSSKNEYKFGLDLFNENKAKIKKNKIKSII